MGRKPHAGKCIHCLRWHKDLTWDHVFPKSWYPTTTPVHMHKWQIPSCSPCNKKYGELEEDLLLRLALCLDPSDPKCAGIVDKALRALNPAFGKNEKDSRMRLAKRTKILRECFHGEAIPLHAAYPNFGAHVDLPIEEQVAVTIKANSVKRLAEKIVKGIFYLENRSLIQPPFLIESYTLTNVGALPIVEMLNRFGEVHAREPGIVVNRAVTPEDATSSFFCIEIWGRFKMYASVTKVDALQ